MALRPLIPSLGGGCRGRQSLGQAWLTRCILGQPGLHIETLSLKEKKIIFCLGYISVVECLSIIQEALGSLPNITHKTQNFYNKIINSLILFLKQDFMSHWLTLNSLPNPNAFESSYLYFPSKCQCRWVLKS